MFAHARTGCSWLTKAGLVLLLCLAVTCSWRNIGQAQSCSYNCDCPGWVNFRNIGFVSHQHFYPNRCWTSVHSTMGIEGTAGDEDKGQFQYCSNNTVCYSGVLFEWGEDQTNGWDLSDFQPLTYFQICEPI